MTPTYETLVLPYLNHAVRMLESGYATAPDIDAAMRFGCGYPEGPLATIDALGAALVRDALAARYAETGDHLHQPADLLERLASDGARLTEAVAVPSAEPQLQHEIRTIGVVGTGTMASGIVQVFAQSGYDVVFVGRTPDKVAGVAAYVAKSLDRAVERGKCDAETKAAVLERMTGTTERADLATADIVVEAIAEDLAAKTELFRDLDRILRPGAILATTTSSLPITELAKATGRAADVIGMHFFNPAQVMRLVEIVTTDLTGADVDATVKALTSRIGKVAVSCGDRAGFIVNALLFPYLNDAVTLAEAGHDIDAIDREIKETAGFPMGPFELLDVVGNDVSLAIQQELYREFGEPGLAPAPMLVAKVAAGELGRKTKQGFRHY